MSKQFRWMTKSPPPSVPAFSFFIAMLSQFADCWGDGKLEQWAAAPERTKVEKMMAKGMTFEQATVEHGKQHAMTELRDEMTKREIQVRARVRTAEIKEKRAETLAEMEGRAPVHPRSIAAERMRREAALAPTPSPTLDEEMPPLSAPMVDPNRNPFDE